jgi:hypothetical protein
MARPDPSSCPPRGMCREEAARWVGVSLSLFDQMVKDGRMPLPKLINSRVIWDRYQLDPATLHVRDPSTPKGFRKPMAARRDDLRQTRSISFATIRDLGSLVVGGPK